jgi:hypothetical protein
MHATDRPAYIVTNPCAYTHDAPYVVTGFVGLARLWLRASNESERWVVTNGARRLVIRGGFDRVVSA